MQLLIVADNEVRELLGLLGPCSTSVEMPRIRSESVSQLIAAPDSVSSKPTISAPRKRSTDRHKDDSRHNKYRVYYRPMYFLDGEGVNIDTGIVHKDITYEPQNYSLFTAIAPDGTAKVRLVGDQGTGRIPSKQLLDALLNLPPNTTKFSFYFNYDVSNILHDMPPRYWAILHKKTSVIWKNYRISFVPKKQFTVSTMRRRGDTAKVKLSCNIWDMSGFSQSSFEEAIASWDVATEEDKAVIKAGKAGRGGFTTIDDSVIEYNAMEGILGCRIFKEILDGAKELDLSLKRFDGAGSVASAMLRKHSVQPYIKQKEPLDIDLMLRGYIGGRFDINAIGTYPKVWEYDINSAYPSVARNLPCLTHSTWQYRTSYSKDYNALWHVQWDLHNPLWAPLPWRDYKGEHHPHYFASGEGWYYGREVHAALQLYPNIKVIEGFSLVSECDHLPFGFIDYYFTKRSELKKEGKNGAQKVIKLGLNSLYGKTAQTKTGVDNQGVPIVPKNQCMIWAGMITSQVRGMILEGIALNPSAVRVIATDAVISTSELDLPLGSGLGEWGSKELLDFTIVGNGVYGCENTDDKGNRLKFGARGYSGRSLEKQWNAIREQFIKGDLPFKVMVENTRFVHCLDAMARNRWDLRNTWTHNPLTLTVKVPDDKYQLGDVLHPRKNPDTRISNVHLVTPERLRTDSTEIDTEVYEDTSLGI